MAGLIYLDIRRVQLLPDKCSIRSYPKTCHKGSIPTLQKSIIIPRKPAANAAHQEIDNYRLSIFWKNLCFEGAVFMLGYSQLHLQ